MVWPSGCVCVGVTCGHYSHQGFSPLQRGRFTVIVALLAVDCNIVCLYMCYVDPLTTMLVAHVLLSSPGYTMPLPLLPSRGPPPPALLSTLALPSLSRVLSPSLATRPFLSGAEGRHLPHPLLPWARLLVGGACHSYLAFPAHGVLPHRSS